jgi:small-conductance mechanosensitive channel
LKTVLHAQQIMTGDRGGEIIPAGIAPSKITSTQNTFARVHRGTAFILAIDTLIIVIFLSSLVMDNLTGFGSPQLMQVIAILPAIAGGLIWTGYRRQKQWSYWPAAVIISLAALFFARLTFTTYYYLFKEIWAVCLWQYYLVGLLLVQ